jgi:hypothetical protein
VKKNQSPKFTSFPPRFDREITTTSPQKTIQKRCGNRETPPGNARATTPEKNR